MSRYPFRTKVNEYMPVLRGYLEPITLDVRKRRYMQMAGIFEEMKRNGEIETSDPEKFTHQDIVKYIGKRKEAGIKSTTISDDISFLDKLCSYYDNDCVKVMKYKAPSIMPKNVHKRLPPMSISVYDRLIVLANKVDGTDLPKLRMYMVAILGARGGLRPKEIRLVEKRNLTIDGENAKIRLIHVKGENSYGEPRTVPLHPDGFDFICKYVNALEKAEEARGIEWRNLIPTFENPQGTLSYNAINEMMRAVAEELGEKVTLTTCRRTYCQNAIDAGMPVEVVQTMMGHSTSDTTKKHYGWMRPEAVCENAQQYWRRKKEKDDGY